MSSNMKYWNLFGFLFIVLNYNVTIMGKIWLMLMILLRLTVILFGVYPLYEGELAAFICNTQQPGVTSMCYDAFIAVSQDRFWLIELLSVLLPFAVFAIYILHTVVKQVVEVYSLPCSYCKEAKVSANFRVSETASNDKTRTRITCGAHELTIPDFSRAYIIQLLLRIMIEVGFGIGSYYLFGFFVQKIYMCTVERGPGRVDCFVPRSTEKSAMITLLWIVSGLSLLLGLADLFLVVRICRNKKLGEPSRDLSNLGNVDVTENCGNVPMESWHLAKDNAL